MSTPPSAPDFLAEVLAYIEAHSLEPVTVAELASVAGFSPYHFSRLFTARFAESVMSYVLTRRLRAAALRLTGDAPPALVELAFDCGFESQKAFTRAFRRRYGAPPGQFQRSKLILPNLADRRAKQKRRTYQIASCEQERHRNTSE